MTSERISASLRRQVRERAKGFCEYCLCPADFCLRFYLEVKSQTNISRTQLFIASMFNPATLVERRHWTI